MISERVLHFSEHKRLAPHSKNVGISRVIQLVASVSLAVALIEPSLADSESSSVAAISDESSVFSIAGSSQRSIAGSSQRSIAGSSQRSIVSIVGTVDDVDDVLGLASIDGHEVYVGSAYLSGDLAIGMIVLVSGVSSVDGELVLADDVTVLAQSDDAHLSGQY